jgi:uncharacterized protein YndB with AHSA1/START domain
MLRSSSRSLLQLIATLSADRRYNNCLIIDKDTSLIDQDTVSSEEVVIEASVEFVWAVLTDFENYAAWNTFCPSCEAELVLGAPVKMQVDLGFGLQEQIEFMCRIDPLEAIAWRMANEPGDAIHAVRTQHLKKLGDARCSYVSSDTFSGEAAPQMMELMAKPVEDGFNRCAIDLKNYCELTFARR